MEFDSLFLTENEAGERLDKVLAHYFKTSHSRTYFQYLIEEGLVLLNGEIVKKRTKVQSGDEVEIHFAATPEIKLTPENIPLDVLFEDDFIIVINKPVGMVVHPAPGNWSGTFVNGLLFHCNSLETKSDCIRPGIVHRLDKETSGVLVAAKTLEVQQKLVELFALREVYKEYYAVCIGSPPNREVNEPIGRHPVNRKAMAVIENGRPSVSIFETLKNHGKLSLVKVILKTGRTHQIRVHLKHLGFPILGDSLYGCTAQNRHYHAVRQLLHARCIGFTHPKTGQKVFFEAPIPPDMQQYSL